MKTFMKTFVTVCVVWGTVSCAPVPRLVLPDVGRCGQTDLDSLLATTPLSIGENIRAVVVGRTETSSYHLVQVRDRERPHVHATHDLSVTLLRGKGSLYVAGVVHELRPGDVAVVPRATPHYFVNAASTPSVAFVTFTPPYDGTDQVPVE